MEVPPTTQRCCRGTPLTVALAALLSWAGCQPGHHTTPGATTIYETFLASKDSIEGEYLHRTGTRKVWGIPDTVPLAPARGAVLLHDKFTSTDAWCHEGIGGLSLPEPGVMELACVGSAQGGEGCMAFTYQDFPDSITIEFGLKVLTTRGLVIVKMAVQGTGGEDMLTDLPPRRGVFADYVFNPRIRSYHLSLSRYDDDGSHTGVSNWRRSPGLVLMGQQDDLCKQPGRWYRIRITKLGPRLQLAVDGEFAGGFVDPGDLPGPFPAEGKIGFRLIGDDVRAQVRDLAVRRYGTHPVSSSSMHQPPASRDAEQSGPTPTPRAARSQTAHPLSTSGG
jgi:hypothetical protein